jgi:hypothetical protein
MSKKRIVIGSAACGFVWGMMLVVVALVFDLPKSVMTVYQVVNMPALWFAQFWTHSLLLPPRGEIAWVAVPSVAILSQWSCAGLLVGVLMTTRRKRW